MKRAAPTLILILILLPAATALDLSNYPNQFFLQGDFDAKIVVGEDAPSQDVASAIELIRGMDANFTERTSMLDTQVDEQTLQSTNIISMGNACDNTVTKKIMGIEKDCGDHFTEGEGYIYLYKNDLGKAHLAVAGGTPDDTEKAAMVLGNHTNYDLNGNAIIVTGDNPPFTLQQTRLPIVSGPEATAEETQPDEEDESGQETSQETQEQNVVSEKEMELKQKIERYTANDSENQSPNHEQPQETSEEEPEFDSFWQKAWHEFKQWLGWFFQLEEKVPE